MVLFFVVLVNIVPSDVYEKVWLGFKSSYIIHLSVLFHARANHFSVF